MRRWLKLGLVVAVRRNRSLALTVVVIEGNGSMRDIRGHGLRYRLRKTFGGERG